MEEIESMNDTTPSTANTVTIDSDDFAVLDELVYLHEATLTVIGPLDRPVGTITFAGPAHPKATAWENEVGQRNNDEIYEQQRQGTRYKPKKLSLVQQRRRNFHMLVARMISWTGFRVRNGDGTIHDTPFSEETAYAFLADPQKPWLFRQCFDFIQENDNFLPKSPPT